MVAYCISIGLTRVELSGSQPPNKDSVKENAHISIRPYSALNAQHENDTVAWSQARRAREQGEEEEARCLADALAPRQKGGNWEACFQAQCFKFNVLGVPKSLA